MEIRYLIQNGAAEWVKFDDSENERLKLVFEPRYSGAIAIGGKVFILHEGEVTIPTRLLPDGELFPRLETDAGIFVAEGLIKQGHSVSVLKSDEGLIRRILLRCYNLEQTVSSLGRAVSDIESDYRGHDLFNFERKEK